MGLFTAANKQESVVLIDIDSSSVGGALAQIESGMQPSIYYSVRVLIESKEHESVTDAMLRTLNDVIANLVSRGAPVLRQSVKSGRIDRILVSVGAPWQKTTVRVESVSEAKPFIFTQALLTEITQKGTEIPEGYIKSGESVVATLLNGYDTPNPFGKKVTRVELIVLSSLLDKSIAEAVEKTLRKTYHTHALMLTAFASAAYTVFRDVFPHEKDFLVVEVSGEATDIAFVKRGLLVDVGTIEHGVNDLIRGARSSTSEDSGTVLANATLIDASRNARFGTQIEEAEKTWLTHIQTVLQEAAIRHALPRTLFLLSEPGARDYLKRLLDNPSMRSLWLTDEPLRIIPVAAGQFTQFVKIRGDAESDIFLMMLALFAQKF